MKPEFENTDQQTNSKHPGNGKYYSRLGFVVGAAVLAVLSGSVGCVYGPPNAGYAESPVYVGGGAGVQDDYVYYPGYQVYYSNHRHEYIYQDGHSWVSRPAPPRVSSEVLVSAPSVRLDFHDHPSNHHATVARQYPQNWAPPGQARGHNQGYGERN